MTDTTPPSAEEREFAVCVHEWFREQEPFDMDELTELLATKIREAERAGRRRGLEEAAAVADDYERGENASSEILALIDDEPGNE